MCNSKKSPLKVREQNTEPEVTFWVHQNVLKMNKKFGAHCQGCEWMFISFYEN